MKKIIAMLSVIAVFGAAYGYDVCGPDINASEVAYTTVTSQNGVYIGYWAVGTGCVGATTVADFGNACTAPSLTGTAFCSSQYWYDLGNNDLDESTSSSSGGYCWCRRTSVRLNGVMTDSIGQAVMVAIPGTDYSDTSGCRAKCAEICAQAVSTNDNGMRHAIMTLSAF